MDHVMMFYQHLTIVTVHGHALFLPVLLMSYMFTWILSLHTFYAYFTHGPNTSASAQYDNTRGAWLTQEGCTITERKEGREVYAKFIDRADHARACSVEARARGRLIDRADA